ncbi:MAG: DUF4173 domain-containing protein [Candidatus Obscuribacter phosphatis]|uniref:DUF4173 domain-containing protein n=1 Tax=Candidatus Obscuribacter phosphatis TaxID=1906157 RepID=A0A8J7P9X7_9BACT|nr:DUF4173 domain-containing protein [Candidatus Obscuribacter phosphatis]
MPISLTILLASLALGGLARALLDDSITHGAPLGLGMTLIVMLNTSAAILSLLLIRKENKRALLFFIPAALASTGLSLNDSPWLRALDIAAISISTAFGVYASISKEPMLSGVMKTIQNYSSGAIAPLLAAIELVSENIAKRTLMNDEASRIFGFIMKGSFIATPFLLVFTALLCSADAAFAKHLGDFIKLFDLPKLLELSVTTSILSAMVGGLLWSVAQWTAQSEPNLASTASEASTPSTNGLERNSLEISSTEIASAENAGSESASRRSNSQDLTPATTGIKIALPEMATALTLLNLLFGAFVCVQIKYLFGGAHLVQITSGLTFAEYARRGFFELCTVSVLMLPLLLSADAVCPRASKKAKIVFNTLVSSTVLLLLTIVASAIERMQLYSREYGMSELRFFTTAFMLYLATIFLAYLASVIRAQRRIFVPATYALGLISISALHMVNPEYIISKSNMSRPADKIDVGYVLSLSCDGLPPIVDELPRLPEAERKHTASQLLARLNGAWKIDWRAFNLSRMTAYIKVKEAEPQLRKYAGTANALQASNLTASNTSATASPATASTNK